MNTATVFVTITIRN